MAKRTLTSRQLRLKYKEVFAMVEFPSMTRTESLDNVTQYNQDDNVSEILGPIKVEHEGG